MTATNHVLTGVLIASVVHSPEIALPVAFLSHFVLDSLPHYGDKSVVIGSTKFNIILAVDIYIALMCLAAVYLLHPAHTQVLILGGILAASPDLMWIPDFINGLLKRPAPTYGPIRRFHSRIQKYARPNGMRIEAAYFGLMIIGAIFLSF